MPFVATALTSVPSLATVWSRVTSPVALSTVTPNVGLSDFSFHTPASLAISIVVSAPPFVGVYVTLTLSTSPLGVTLTVAVPSSAVTVGAAGAGYFTTTVLLFALSTPSVETATALKLVVGFNPLPKIFKLFPS